MRSLSFTATALLATLAVSAFVPGPRGRQSPQKEPATRSARAAVLVELFTSEGCSSCPPADALLARLYAAQEIPGAEIIPLEEHVDYWNHLGWADPFSSAQFSKRQELYAETSGEDSVYTPQMVVDGRRSFVGSQEGEARRAITEAAREQKTSIGLTLKIVGNARSIAISVPRVGAPPGGDQAEVYLAITEDGLESAVSRGENAGSKLSHIAVVRSLQRIGVASASTQPAFEGGIPLKAEPGWNIARLHAIAFVQQQKSRRVLGAASLSLR